MGLTTKRATKCGEAGQRDNSHPGQDRTGQHEISSGATQNDVQFKT